MKSVRWLTRGLTLMAAVLCLSQLGLQAAETNVPPSLHLNSPVDYQVNQRDGTKAVVMVAGTLSKPAEQTGAVEARLVGPGMPAEWRKLGRIKAGQNAFGVEMKVPQGGWYQLDVRVRVKDTIAAESAVAHVGVGEVFIIAGQSNSANHGEERQETKTGLVASCHNGKWRLANDPQPGASGNGGSFIPPFGDAIVERFRVPVGIIAAGVGATSVREWLPRGTRFPNPPTLTGHVTQLANGEWESKGTLFDGLVARMKSIGPHGFRAVLWHQGESDANQRDASRTLPGVLYRQLMEQFIRDSRRAVGWKFPWFVAQVSYHTPDDPGSTEIRAAQQALWKAGIALEGPDTDALVGDFRDSGGKGVHFSSKGLREHGARWAEKVSPWLEERATPARPVSQRQSAVRPVGTDESAASWTNEIHFLPCCGVLCPDWLGVGRRRCDAPRRIRGQ